MDWNQVERMWTQTKDKVREKWAKLTDDDLEVINGQRNRLRSKSNNATALHLITFAKR